MSFSHRGVLESVTYAYRRVNDVRLELRERGAAALAARLELLQKNIQGVWLALMGRIEPVYFETHKISVLDAGLLEAGSLELVWAGCEAAPIESTTLDRVAIACELVKIGQRIDDVRADLIGNLRLDVGEALEMAHELLIDAMLAFRDELSYAAISRLLTATTPVEENGVVVRFEPAYSLDQIGTFIAYGTL
jgi:hypothetical protein